MKADTPTIIAGFAGCTSLGYSLEASLAAMGSRLSNFSDTGIKNLFGTPVMAGSLLEPDAPRIERLPALARWGLADLHSLLTRLGLEQSPLLVGLPPDLSDDEMARVGDEFYRGSTPYVEAPWFPFGRASTFPALALAMDLIAAGTYPLVTVCGIDSLCAPEIVARLVNAARVLGPHTEGTIPGEAAVFAVLCRADHRAADPSASVLLEGVARSRSPVPFVQADRVSGDGLASAFGWFRDRGAQRVNRIVAAHSGEGYFGNSFGHAYLRSLEVMPEPLEVELTADCVGDVGAASGLLGLAFGMYRMATDAPGVLHRALVYSESDSGEIGAAIIEGKPTCWMRASAAAATSGCRE
jgi:3-oxoacyl-[acyl-carrier-protein] synthase I